jgi:hypothetical protein
MSFEDSFSFETFMDITSKGVNKSIDQNVKHAVLQVQGDLPYNRRYGTAYSKMESQGISLLLLVQIGTSLIESVGRYNNDTNSIYDKRVAVPFDSIEISDDGRDNGEIDLTFDYFRLKDKSLLKAQI